MELIKGINYLREGSLRDKYAKERIAKRLSDDPDGFYQELDQMASSFVYGVRSIPKRTDMEVACVYYYPEADRSVTRTCLFPKFYVNDIDINEVRFWAVVKFYGLTSRRKFRGYLPIAQLIQSQDEYDSIEHVKKGTQIGPLVGDVAPCDMIRVDNRWLKPRIPHKVDRGRKAWRPHPMRRQETRTNLSEELEARKSDRRFKLMELANERLKGSTATTTTDDSKPIPFSKEWYSGERIDVFNDGQWYAATVLDTKAGDPHPVVLVSYDGYDATFDEWVPTRGATKSRLAPLHMFSRRPKKKKRANLTHVNPQMAKKIASAHRPKERRRSRKEPVPAPQLLSKHDDDDDEGSASEVSVSTSESESSYFSDDEVALSSDEEDDLARRELANKIRAMRATFARSTTLKEFPQTKAERLQNRVKELEAEVDELNQQIQRERRERSAVQCCTIN